LWNYNFAESIIQYFLAAVAPKIVQGQAYAASAAASVLTPMQASDYYIHRVGIPHNRIIYIPVYTYIPSKSPKNILGSNKAKSTKGKTYMVTKCGPNIGPRKLSTYTNLCMSSNNNDIDWQRAFQNLLQQDISEVIASLRV